MVGQQEFFREEKGMVLLASLLLLSLLMVAGMGAWIAVQNDYKITTNLRRGTAVFYLSEAGIAWGKQQISQTVVHPPRPADRTQSFSAGTFSVAFLSSTPVTPLSAKVVIRSTGAAGLSSQTVEAQVSKTYDLADAAIALRGAEASVALSDSSFLVSGFDHDPVSGGMVARARPRLAISTSGATLRTQIDAALLSLKTGSVVGGDDGKTLSQSDFIPSPAITRIGEDLCRAPQAVRTAMPLGGTLSLAGETWGSRSAPQLHCLEGLPAVGDAVTIGGKFSGAGILVVRDAELIANGTFRWEGLIIVTGTSVGFRAAGNEDKEIYGALMINEVGPAIGVTPISLQLDGAIKVLYSRAALLQAAGLLPTAILENAYASLPFMITQDYWRSISP